MHYAAQSMFYLAGKSGYNQSLNMDRIIATLYIVVTFSLGGCRYAAEKIYPNEKLTVDSNFLKLYNSLIKEDTFSFKNQIGSKKEFVITDFDSIVINSKGPLINQRPYKLLITHFRAVGDDTVSSERANEIFVNKYPDNGINSIVIQFNNFYFSKDTTLPPISPDTAKLNNTKFTNYYKLESSWNLMHLNDVKFLYLSPEEGIIGFVTLSGEVWERERKGS